MKPMLSVALLIALSLLSSCTQMTTIKIEYVAEPCLIPVKNGLWKLCDNMIVHIDNKYHAVPKGFKTDLASIPRPLWWMYAPSDYDSIASAVLHDWHYCCSKGVSRLDADNIFYAGLRAQGMPHMRASIYYMGVRALGWMFYAEGEGLALHMAEFDKNHYKGVFEDVNYRLV